VQNQLQEFYAMATFCNPDALGTLSVFNRVFGHPIARSHDRDATEEERTLGQARSEELARRVESFVLRRGAEVNSAYLPPLSLYVVFTPPTPVQLRLLTSELGSGSVRRLLTASGSDFGDQVLTVLTNIRKICGHPVLYDGVGKGEHAAGEGVGASAPASEIAIDAIDAKQSGKMAALEVLLCHIIGGHGDRSSNESSLATSDPRRRCVVVSQSTAMLDVIARVCAQHGWSTVRLDGSTEVSRRQDLVNSFNSFGVGQIFLLSTTAGGAGLNLTGACRLILCDLHWYVACKPFLFWKEFLFRR
jgi:DNA repair and recombination protein RAD54B